MAAAAVFFLAYSQLFGSKSAPLNFSRYPAWFVDVLAFLFAVPLSYCVDDMIPIERAAVIDSGRAAWMLVSRLCGWLISEKKSPPPAGIFNVIGVSLDLRP